MVIHGEEAGSDGRCYSFDIQGRCRWCGYVLTDAEEREIERRDAEIDAEYDSWPDEMKMHCEYMTLVGGGEIIACSELRSGQ